ncbi:MAG TPA: hypothetical protein VFP71_13395 [Candidatus Angelobacter sp.]|nr:hypothetical protein [Candidatus Angelobacter sp.]
MQHTITQGAAAVQTPAERALEARYAYYLRCQTVRRNGQQCKAPAEKNTQICYAHAQQQAMQERRERERRAVLEEAARQVAMRPALQKERAGWSIRDFSVAEIFTDFNAIQVTIAVMAQALIDGRIDCKTAGRLAVELQTASKLLWLQQKAAMKWKAQSRAELSRTDQSRTEQRDSGISSSGAGQNVARVLVGHDQNAFEELKTDFLSSSGGGLNTDLFCNPKVGAKLMVADVHRAGLKTVQIRQRGSPPQEWRNSEKAA